MSSTAPSHPLCPLFRLQKTTSGNCQGQKFRRKPILPWEAARKVQGAILRLLDNEQAWVESWSSVLFHHKHTHTHHKPSQHIHHLSTAIINASSRDVGVMQVPQMQKAMILPSFSSFHLSLWSKCWLHNVMAIELHHQCLDWFPITLTFTMQICKPLGTKLPGKSIKDCLAIQWGRSCLFPL